MHDKIEKRKGQFPDWFWRNDKYKFEYLNVRITPYDFELLVYDTGATAFETGITLGIRMK